VEISNATIAEAMRLRSPGDGNLTDYADTRIPGLILRVRGVAVSWMFKTSAKTKKLGSPPEVGIREARRSAELELASYNVSKQEKTPVEAPEPIQETWTWKELSDRYVAHISGTRMKNGKEKAPSDHTTVDVKRAFARAALSPWQDMPVSSLGAVDLVDAIRKTMDDVSYRQAVKLHAYARSALTWAISNSAREAGLSDAWWSAVRVPEPTGDEVHKILDRQRPTAVEGFGVSEVAKFLAIHEDYCRSRFGNRRVSPSTRWGIWWIALTAVRRGIATALKKTDVRMDDKNLKEGWGLAIYPAKEMKARRDFWLPFPPILVRVLSSLERDWREAVDKTHGRGNETEWLFPSNQRVGRKDGNHDPRLSESALNLHLEAMRGNRQAGHRDLLSDLPRFTLHSLRSAAVTHLVDRTELAPGAASAMLAHVMPVDPSAAKLSPTTKAFYSLAQHCDSKSEAMEAWTEAVLSEYKKVGGVIPI
jgi:integrase